MHGKVKPGGRLIEDHDFGAQQQDTSQAHTALLAAGKFMRVALGHRHIKPNGLHDFGDPGVLFGFIGNAVNG